jgi:hypothetical protein
VTERLKDPSLVTGELERIAADSEAQAERSQREVARLEREAEQVQVKQKNLVKALAEGTVIRGDDHPVWHRSASCLPIALPITAQRDRSRRSESTKTWCTTAWRHENPSARRQGAGVSHEDGTAHAPV